MTESHSTWGIELVGDMHDKTVWKTDLKHPFDPYVIEVSDNRGPYLVLRSTKFEGQLSSQDVYTLAKQLLEVLNVAVSKNLATGPLAAGAVVEFVEDGRALKHLFVEPASAAITLRGQPVKLIVRDHRGVTVLPKPSPSRAQQWMHAAAIEPKIDAALTYLKGTPGWVELYNAYELLNQMPRGAISKKKEDRFTQTANAVARHPLGKYTAHRRPMSLTEARQMLDEWLCAAIEAVIKRSDETLRQHGLESLLK